MSDFKKMRYILTLIRRNCALPPVVCMLLGQMIDAIEAQQPAGRSAIRAGFFDTKEAPPGKCKYCGGTMLPGIAMGQTVSGLPDFPGGDVMTVSPGGPGVVIDCDKCVSCGYSVTRSEG